MTTGTAALTALLAVVAAAIVALAILLHASHAPGTLSAFTPALPLRAMADELLRAALQRYPADPQVQVAMRTIRAVEPDSPEDMVNHARKTVRRGKFDRATGVLKIATARHTGQPLPDGVVRGILVHEVAHAALPSGAHSPEWREVYLRLLRVATEDLGWHVSLECSACTFYGVCAAAQCPRCERIPCKASKASKSRQKPGLA